MPLDPLLYIHSGSSFPTGLPSISSWGKPRRGESSGRNTAPNPIPLLKRQLTLIISLPHCPISSLLSLSSTSAGITAYPVACARPSCLRDLSPYSPCPHQLRVATFVQLPSQLDKVHWDVISFLPALPSLLSRTSYFANMNTFLLIYWSLKTRNPKCSAKSCRIYSHCTPGRSVLFGGKGLLILQNPEVWG